MEMISNLRFAGGTGGGSGGTGDDGGDGGTGGASNGTTIMFDTTVPADTTDEQVKINNKN